MEKQRWTDCDMCGFAGYYSGRIISAPQMKITEILKEYEDDCKATIERIEASKNLVKPVVSGSLPLVHDVIESRIKHFESINHTYEANELKQALSSIQRLIPPIMFKIGSGNYR